MVEARALGQPRAEMVEDRPTAMYLRSHGPRRISPRQLRAVLSLGPHRVQVRHRKVVEWTAAVRSFTTHSFVLQAEHFLRPGVSLQDRAAAPRRTDSRKPGVWGRADLRHPAETAPNIQKLGDPRGSFSADTTDREDRGMR